MSDITQNDMIQIAAGSERGRRLVQNLQEKSPYVATSVDLTLTRVSHAGAIVRTSVKDKDLTLPLSSTMPSGTKFTMLVGAAATDGGATLKVAGTNKVNGGTSGKGLINSATTDAAGDSVTVAADGAGGFWTIAQRGTWNAQS
jgi:hypothetical protein